MFAHVYNISLLYDTYLHDIFLKVKIHCRGYLSVVELINQSSWGFIVTKHVQCNVILDIYFHVLAALTIDCYDCSSQAGSHIECEDQFVKDVNTAKFIARDCFYGYWRANYCIKLKGVRGTIYYLKAICLCTLFIIYKVKLIINLPLNRGYVYSSDQYTRVAKPPNLLIPSCHKRSYKQVASNITNN